MSTLSILVGFALMLFLPCAIAMLGSRDTEDESVYSDRTVEPIIRTRVAKAVDLGSPAVSAPAEAIAEPAKPAAAAQTATQAANQTPTQTPTQTKAQPAAKPAAPVAGAGIDPVLYNRAPKAHQARILRSEIEALMATATAARAQADALAANARLAAAKAEAADAAASAAEDAAAEAIQEMRRAA